MSCACQSKAGGRLHWLGGLYWEKTRDKNSGSTYYMPGLRYDGAAFQYSADLRRHDAAGLDLAARGRVVRLHRTRSDYLQTDRVRATSTSTSPTS